MYTMPMLVNFVMIALLIVTIVYALILNSRLKKIRDARDDLYQIIHRFTEATQKARESIESLKKTAATLEGKIESHMNRAEELKSDLSFFIKRGDEVASRLEDLILSQKNKNNVTQKPQPKSRETPQEAIMRAIKEMRE